MRAQRLTTIIFIGMLLGIAVGYACHELWPDPQTAKTIAGYISLFTDIFLRLIKMIIAPLVFTTLVVGVAHMGDTKSVGRIGGKAMLWFVSASLVSLLLGLIMVNILRPGDNLNLPLPDANAATNLNAASLLAVLKPNRNGSRISEMRRNTLRPRKRNPAAISTNHKMPRLK